MKANYQKTEGDNPVVTAEITITPGDYLTNSFTLTVTDGTGKVVYTNAKAGTDPIVLTAEDLGVEVLNTEDEFYANVTVNDVSGYIAKAVTPCLPRSPSAGAPVRPDRQNFPDGQLSPEEGCPLRALPGRHEKLRAGPGTPERSPLQKSLLFDHFIFIFSFFLICFLFSPLSKSRPRPPVKTQEADFPPCKIRLAII